MQQSAPSISVVICNFNYEKFIARAVDSALEQSYQAKEIIVVDDGSTDRSWEILQNYQGRVTLIHQKNGGQAAAYNRGMDPVSGDFVLFLDSDDCLDKDCLEVLAQRLTPDIARAHWRLRLVDHDGNQTGGYIPRILFNGTADHRLLSKGVMPPASPGSGNVYNTRLLKSVMPLPLDAIDRHAADFFTIRASTWLGRILAIEDRPLGCYRIDTAREAESLIFGNADKRRACPYQNRIDRFKAWMGGRRPDLAALLPSDDIDFSMQKQSYAASIFDASNYFQGVSAAMALWPSLLKSIRYYQGGMIAKFVLALWSVVIMLMPRRLGLPIAGYVCNPARRN